jgi:hypothetical protein
MTLFHAKWSLVALGVAAGLFAADSSARAQVSVRGASMPGRPSVAGPRAMPATAARTGITVNPTFQPSMVNPNPYLAPGLTLKQAAYNTKTMGDAMWHVPWWMTGYQGDVRWTPRDGWEPPSSGDVIIINGRRVKVGK